MMASEGHTDPGWCEQEAVNILASLGVPRYAPKHSNTPGRDNVIWLAERLKAKLDKVADSYAMWR